MKVLQISAVRAIIVLVTGFLLVKYREDTMTWMTITVGVLFLISGLVACMVYYFEKEKVAKKTAKAALQEDQQEEEDLKSPSAAPTELQCPPPSTEYSAVHFAAQPTGDNCSVLTPSATNSS